MKTKLEIIKAHDILHSQALPDDPRMACFDETAAVLIREKLGAFCWVLGHPGGKSTQKNLDAIESELENRGFRLERRGEPVDPDAIDMRDANFLRGLFKNLRSQLDVYSGEMLLSIANRIEKQCQ